MNAKTIIMLLKNLMLMINSISSLNFFQQPDHYLEILDEIERFINLVLLVSTIFYSHGWIYIYRIGTIIFKLFLIIGGFFWYCSQRLYSDLMIIESWLKNLNKKASVATIPSNPVATIPSITVIQQENTPPCIPDVTTQVIRQENINCKCKKNGILKTLNNNFN